MSRESRALLRVAVAAFGFDPAPETSPGRALQVVTVEGRLPQGTVDPDERLAGAAGRLLRAAGVRAEGRRLTRMHLVGVDDGPARSRTLTAWFYTSAPVEPLSPPARWITAGRSPKLPAADMPAFRAALDQLRRDTRQVGDAAAMIGEVFTGEDLLRLHISMHGGPEGSDRTFRRRVQELRDGGVLRPVRSSEVAGLRLRQPRFRSPAVTGGRPPELFRYAGSGADDEQLAGLRARRSA
jgi:hypothetical protein